MNNTTESQMLQLLTQQQNNPEAFAQLILEFGEYFNNTGSIESKIKLANENWQPSSAPTS